MKKVFGKLTAILLTVCLFAICLMAVGCESSETTETTYSVTVLCDDDTAAQNVKVSWGSFGGITTDANGKASIQLESGDYEISLSALPAGYSYGTKVTATAKNPSVTITLTKDASDDPGEDETVLTYTVKVLDPDGQPIEGARVGLCSEKGCASPRDTGANGVVSFKSTELLESANGNYHVQIFATSIPGFTYPHDSSNYYIDDDGNYIEVTPDKPDLTIQLTEAE